jgi:hypothetical protein
MGAKLAGQERGCSTFQVTYVIVYSVMVVFVFLLLQTVNSNQAGTKAERGSRKADVDMDVGPMKARSARTFSGQGSDGQLESGIDNASTRNMSVMMGVFVPGSFVPSTRDCSKFHAMGDGIKVWLPRRFTFSDSMDPPRDLGAAKVGSSGFNVQVAPLERGSVQGLRYSTLNFEQVVVRAPIER